jgi:hypothetical protein
MSCLLTLWVTLAARLLGEEHRRQINRQTEACVRVSFGCTGGVRVGFGVFGVLLSIGKRAASMRERECQTSAQRHITSAILPISSIVTLDGCVGVRLLAQLSLHACARKLAVLKPELKP